MDKHGSSVIYQLTTLTYGTAPAAFLATRVLNYLAEEEKEMLSGAKAIRNNMYVDDLLAGSSNVEDTVKLYTEVRSILEKGKLPIRKFCSNSAEVMKAIPVELHGSSLKVGDKDVIKTLGMLWLPEKDVFTFHHDAFPKPITKRSIISEVSSVFDPLGLIAPITVLGKLLIQRLWTLKVDWDESLPQVEVTSWLKLKNDFQTIHDITIPRYIFQGKPKNITLHGFGDASKSAYATVFYVRSKDEMGNITVRLLCSKTRVAPLKTITLPRLELLGGLLTANLYEKINPLLPFTVNQTFLWLDASITITWIKASPHKWTSFVATRVTKIQSITSGCQWRHVSSEDNPADIASRGMLPSKLATSNLWFSGPAFLTTPSIEWPNRFVSDDVIPEMATAQKVLEVIVKDQDLVSQAKYQSWNALRATFAYVQRFINNLKLKVLKQKSQAPPSSIIRRETLKCKSKPSGVGCRLNGEYPQTYHEDKDTRSSLLQVQSSPKLTTEELESGLIAMVKIITSTMSSKHLKTTNLFQNISKK